MAVHAHPRVRDSSGAHRRGPAILLGQCNHSIIHADRYPLGLVHYDCYLISETLSFQVLLGVLSTLRSRYLADRKLSTVLVASRDRDSVDPEDRTVLYS